MGGVLRARRANRLWRRSEGQGHEAHSDSPRVARKMRSSSTSRSHSTLAIWAACKSPLRADITRLQGGLISAARRDVLCRRLGHPRRRFHGTQISPGHSGPYVFHQGWPCRLRKTHQLREIFPVTPRALQCPPHIKDLGVLRRRLPQFFPVLRQIHPPAHGDQPPLRPELTPLKARNPSTIWWNTAGTWWNITGWGFAISHLHISNSILRHAGGPSPSVEIDLLCS